MKKQKVTYYADLLEKYGLKEFKTKAQRKSYMKSLRKLLNESEKDVSFEEKIFFINSLTGCVILKNVDHFA